MWKSIKFNKQNIEHDTGKAVLIKMPKNSKFGGWCFWRPAKLVKEMDKGKGYWLTFSYTDDFDFTIIKKKKKESISVSDLEKAFGIMNEEINHADKWTKNKENESYLHAKEPKKIDKEVGVDESLKR